jgi:hypothetical protein
VSTPTCRNGHPMTVRARFRLDDEATDTPHITEQLAALKREVPGLELGADVTLYYCAVCDYAQAEFAYPDKGTL